MTRLPALDALRGILALVVVLDHEALLLGWRGLDVAAGIAVWGFFAMSAYVLTLAWDGRYGAFLLRRLVRLAPVYLVAWGAGCLALGPGSPGAVDAPTWSLNVEALAMLGFPVIVWAGGDTRRAVAVCAALLALTVTVDAWALWGVWFVAGSAAARAPIRWPMVRNWALQSLGAVSYSLYLTHWIVLQTLGPWGLLAVPPVAWAVWRWVEVPSIRWSRRVPYPPLPRPAMPGRRSLHIPAR